MHQYKQLSVWNLAVDFCIDCYNYTAAFPGAEKYGLTSQIRRAAVSIASNIAGGAGLNSDNEFIHFLGIAGGSICELDTQLLIAERLKFINRDDCNEAQTKLTELQHKVYKLITAIKNKQTK